MTNPVEYKQVKLEEFTRGFSGVMANNFFNNPLVHEAIQRELDNGWEFVCLSQLNDTTYVFVFREVQV